jgi:hypothetical protein
MHLAHMSYWKRSSRGELRNVPLYFAGDQARGDEFNAPVSIVVDVGRRFVIEMTEAGVPVLMLTGEGHGQFMHFLPIRVFVAASKGWYGMRLLYDESDPAERREQMEELATA